MALDDYEAAPEFQLLDSNALADGGFANAHVLRAYARATNRLVRQGEALFSLSWFDRPPGAAEDVELAVRVPTNRRWSRMLAGAWRRPKKPGLIKADVFIHANITTDAVIDIAVETLRSPAGLRAQEGDNNLLRLVGTGAMKVYKFRGIDIDPGPLERFAFHVRGVAGSGGYTVADTTGLASNPTVEGEIAVIEPNGRFQSKAGAPTWNTSPPTLVRAYGIVIHNGTVGGPYGDELYLGQIVAVGGNSTVTLYPPPRDAVVAEALTRQKFFVTKLPTIRLAHLSIWAQDR